MKHTQTICNAAVVALLAAIAWVAACASRTPSAAKASLSADQEAGGGGNLQVSLKSADATFGMTRLALVGADLEFDLTTLVAGAAATKSYRLPLGGPSNAWTETRKAISESTMAVCQEGRPPLRAVGGRGSRPVVGRSGRREVPADDPDRDTDCAMKTLLAVLALCACQQPQRPPGMDPRPLRAAVSSLGGVDEAPGIRIIYGPTSCQWNGPNPVVVPAALPRVGEDVVVRWQLSVVPPPPTILDPDGVAHAPLVVLLGSTRPLASPVPAGGAAPGCWLLVVPDFTIAPAPESWLVYNQSSGIVTMRWRPTAGMEGMDLFTQLVVVHSGANPLGLVSSAGLQLHIGSAAP